MKPFVKHLSTGDVLVFNGKTKDMYLIPPHHASEWKSSKEPSFAVAEEMAKGGKARHLTRKELETLQVALSTIVLLEAAFQ